MNSLPQDRHLDQDARFWSPWTDLVIPYVISPDDDDTPPSGPDFEPDPSDQREAVFMFGEHASYEEEDRFKAWVEGLPAERFRSVRHALDVLRSALDDFQAADDISLDKWLDEIAPDDYESRDFEEVSVIDCRGICNF